MNVSLTPELEKYIANKVKSGMYGSASEVLREALRLHEEQGRLRALRVKGLKRELAAGVEQLDRGESKPFDAAAIKAEGRRRVRRKSKG
jgi:antitoxin ParD1/3/4